MTVGVTGSQGGRGSHQTLRMSDGFELSCKRWAPSGPSRGLILCIHGTGGNSDFFNNFGRDLSSAGFEVYAIDLRGFGLSVEDGLQRGDTSSFRRQLQDIVEALEIVRLANGGRRVFLLGHSHGCAYSIWCAAEHQDLVLGLVLVAPPVASTQKVRRLEFLKFAFLLLVAPRTKYRFESSADPRIPADSPVPDGVSIRWLYGTKKYLHDPLFTLAERIKIPVLILQGGKDRSTLPEGASYLAGRLTTEDKTLEILQEADHFIYDEFVPVTASKEPTGRQVFLGILIGWLNRIRSS